MSESVKVIIVLLAVAAFVAGAFVLASKLFGPVKDTVRRERKFIMQPDIDEAILKVQMGPEKKSRVISDKETMTYSYYHSNVKPKPQTDGKKGFVCKICGYVYEGDTLPEDFICPLCKHGAADFEEIK